MLLNPYRFGSGGGGGGGDPAVWNPSDKGVNITLSSGNEIASASEAGSVRATVSKNSGKWMFEITAIQSASGSWLIGVGTSGAPLAAYVGIDSSGYGYHAGNGNLYNNGTPISYGATYTAPDVMGVCVDFGTNTLTFYKNGVSQGDATINPGTYFPMISASSATGALGQINAGQNAFVYPVTGFDPWTT